MFIQDSTCTKLIKTDSKMNESIRIIFKGKIRKGDFFFPKHSEKRKKIF